MLSLMRRHAGDPIIRRHVDQRSADPSTGMAVGMNAPTTAYANLTKGKTLRRQIHITGGCGGASAKASAIPSDITSCTLNGVVTVKVTGLG